MKTLPATLDKFILFLISFSILVDMINGFVIRTFMHLPVSQSYKLFLILLILFRLLVTRDFLYVALIFIGFQVAPLMGLIKSREFSSYLADVVTATKWFVVPLSFFYFKTLFQTKYVDKLYKPLQKLMIFSVSFLTLNMVLGVLGFGSAFYYEGSSMASGTKGFIFAGNELTILVLILEFIIVSHLRYLERHKMNLFIFILFLFFSFAITSKTVIGGVTLVFLIPYLTSIKWRFKKVWIYRITVLLVLGLPTFIAIFYIGLVNSGFLRTLQYSKNVNKGFLTILLSNRNNYIIWGYDFFNHHFTWIEKIFGLGEHFFLQQVGHLPEIDFFTLLFSAGIFGFLLLLFIILFYFSNAVFLMQKRTYIHAKSVFVFLIFLCVAANLSGHVFNSGIAGVYIGASIALMFYRHKSYLLPV